MTESSKTSSLLSRLRKKRPECFTWKIPGQITGGLADALFIGTVTHAWSEFKRCKVGADPHKKLTALQRKTLEKLDDLGQIVYVVALHDDGSQSMYLFGADFPIRTGKSAFIDEMEFACCG